MEIVLWENEYSVLLQVLHDVRGWKWSPNPKLVEQFHQAAKDRQKEQDHHEERLRGILQGFGLLSSFPQDPFKDAFGSSIWLVNQCQQQQQRYGDYSTGIC